MGRVSVTRRVSPEERVAQARRVAEARGGSRAAEEELLRRCEPMVRALAAQFRVPGMEEEDLRQVARLGVLEAIRDFDPYRGCSFLHFAGCCARRELLSAASTERQPRRRLLNEAGALCPEDPTPDPRAEDLGSSSAIPAPLLRARPYLTHLEYAVAVGWCAERSYDEMARAMGVSTKSIDNAWKRAKAKMRRLPIWE